MNRRLLSLGYGSLVRDCESSSHLSRNRCLQSTTFVQSGTRQERPGPHYNRSLRHRGRAWLHISGCRRGPALRAHSAHLDLVMSMGSFCELCGKLPPFGLVKAPSYPKGRTQRACDARRYGQDLLKALAALLGTTFL